MGGAGTDTAMEAADVVIMNDDLRRIPELIRLSRKTHAVLWQNISLALGIKAVFLVMAVLATPRCGWRCSPTWGQFARGRQRLAPAQGPCGSMISACHVNHPCPEQLTLYFPMRRLVCVFLLIWFPFQISWAAVSSYCQHESGAGAQHFGHHFHVHPCIGRR